MDLIDRLISGAGAVADGADRFAGLFRRGPRRRVGRPVGPVLVASGLLVLAGLLVLVGLEGSGGPTPRPIDADVHDDPGFGDRSYVTVSGQVASEYGGRYFDDNGNARQDPGEAGSDYVYVVVEPTTHAGVTVLSNRSPAEVYRTPRVGRVVFDPSYVAAELPYIRSDVEDLGITLVQDRYIDARSEGITDAATIRLADELPAAGNAVRFDDGTMATWTWSCPTDSDCQEAEASSFDVLVYDEASKRGVIVLTDESPEWTPVTFSGMLRREEHEVSQVLDPSIFDLPSMGVTVSARYLLAEGLTPVDPIVAWGVAAVCAVMAGLILVGLAGGYLVYRRVGTAVPPAARTLAIGAGIPVRVTGWLRTPTGLTRVREASAAVVRFATEVRPTTDAVEADAEAAEPASTLIVERRDRPDGAAVGRGEMRRLSVGLAMPFRGRRPAIRLIAGTGPLVLTFDDAATRDRAAAELAGEIAGPHPPMTTEPPRADPPTHEEA